MTEQLCDFPTCQLARKKGFDEECRHAWVWDEETNEKVELERPHPGSAALKTISIASTMGESVPSRTIQQMLWWNQDSDFNNKVLPKMFYARPTQDLLERWLREVHNIVITIKYYVGPGYYYADLGIISRALSEDGVPGAPFPTFELAREAAIVHALKLLPDVQNKG